MEVRDRSQERRAARAWLVLALGLLGVPAAVVPIAVGAALGASFGALVGWAVGAVVCTYWSRLLVTVARWIHDGSWLWRETALRRVLRSVREPA